MDTALGVAVPTQHFPLGLAQRVIALGVVVHRTRHGGALEAVPRARLCLLFFTFFTTFSNVLTLQVLHHHVQVC